MNNLITINNQNVLVKKYKGQRVLTFKDIDTVHNRPNGTARKRFNDNKKHFIEGEDYFVRKTDEAKKRVWNSCTERAFTYHRKRLSHACEVIHR